MQIEAEPPINRRILHISNRLLEDSISELRIKDPMQIMTNEFQKINCNKENPLIGLMGQRRGELNPFEAYRHHEVLALTHWLLRRQHARSTGRVLQITDDQVDNYLLWLAEISSQATSEGLPQKMINEIGRVDGNAAKFVAQVTGLGTLRKAGYLGAMDVFFPVINIKPQGR